MAGEHTFEVEVLTPEGEVWGGEGRQVSTRTAGGEIGVRANPAPLPADGVLLTKKLGELLGVHAGDSVTVEKREGNREHYRVHVSGLVDEMFGLQGHMRLAGGDVVAR